MKATLFRRVQYHAVPYVVMGRHLATRWSRTGSTWRMQASSSFQQQTLTGLPSFNSWNALGGFGRTLGPQLAIQVAYTIGERGNLGYTAGTVNRGLYNAVRVSFVWSPQARLI